MDILNLELKYVETESEVKGLKDMSIGHTKVQRIDAWLFGDYDAIRII